MEQSKSYTYRLQGIDIVEKQLFRTEPGPVTTYNFNVRTQSAIDEIRKLIIVAIEVTVTKVDDTHTIAHFLVALGFEVIDFENILPRDSNNLISVPIELENALKAISISTVRGIIFSELRGTVMHSAIMPIIQMGSLKPEKGDKIQDVRKPNVEKESKLSSKKDKIKK